MTYCSLSIDFEYEKKTFLLGLDNLMVKIACKLSSIMQ